jgi:hypothetical protein
MSSACDGSARADAATVDGYHIDRARFENELRMLVDNDAFRTQSLQQSSTTNVPVGLSAAWLQNLIYQSAVDAEFDRRGLTLTQADRRAASQSLQQDFGPEVFTAFPEDFQHTLIDRAARFQVLMADMAGPAPTEQQKRAYFEEHKESYAAECPTNLAVSHILVSDEATAGQLYDGLRAGADFAELARQNSIDTGSAANGGDLGCLVPGAFVKEFEDAALAAAPGVPTAPVKTEFGYHLILTDDHYLTYEHLAARVASDIAQAQADPVQSFLLKRLNEADVTVDPRFGSWKRSDQGSQVTPPSAPDVRSGRTPAPTTVPSPISVVPQQ